MSKYLSVLRINWVNALEYRGNALIGLFAIFSGLFIEYQIWSLIFDNSNYSSIKISGSSEGFNFTQLIVFIFLSIIVGQLKSSWATSFQMIFEIRQGLINKYLIRPVSFFWYHFMMFLGVNSLYYIVYSIVIFIFVILFPNILFPTLGSFIGFMISLAVSIYLSYSIYFIMVCFAFWFGEVRSIVLAYNLGMLMISGQYIPVRLFPENIISIISWTPLIYLVDFPVSTAVGLYTLNEWMYNLGFSLLWCLIVTFFSFYIYNKGISQYEAYGQ